MTTTIQRRFTYDHAGRPLRVYHQVNESPEVLLSAYEYNQLGHVINSVHHSRNDGGSFLYQTNNTNSIQGWLEEVTYQFSNNVLVFNQKLDYNEVSGTSNETRLDGMITSNQWRNYESQNIQAYNYTYDLPKRLTGSAYREYNGTSWIPNQL
ncbi:hypothetical protein MM239_14910 [Belliella sp. DSM 111904]|uniref:YD repeat-containing protein n=1 Tax=Belliella filtrata TaxID=2923435 RepID=A0ABS9V2Q5_9BACT|nr:hypothetical protein [Belliella filtrata]